MRHDPPLVANFPNGWSCPLPKHDHTHTVMIKWASSHQCCCQCEESWRLVMFRFTYIRGVRPQCVAWPIVTPRGEKSIFSTLFHIPHLFTINMKQEPLSETELWWQVAVYVWGLWLFFVVQHCFGRLGRLCGVYRLNIAIANLTYRELHQ